MRAASTHGNAVVKASGHRVGIFEVGFYLLMADPTNPVVAFVDCMFWDWFVCDAVVFGAISETRYVTSKSASQTHLNAFTHTATSKTLLVNACIFRREFMPVNTVRLPFISAVLPFSRQGGQSELLGLKF